MNNVLSITAKILALPNLLWRQDSKIYPLPSKKSANSNIFRQQLAEKKTLSAAEVLTKIDPEPVVLFLKKFG